MWCLFVALAGVGFLVYFCSVRIISHLKQRPAIAKMIGEHLFTAIVGGKERREDDEETKKLE